jgi:hypothetical protein
MFHIKKTKQKPVDNNLKTDNKQKEVQINAEISAAIALALDFHLKDVHDYEKTILTIQKAIRPYSPWSSKIYGLREIPYKFPTHLLKKR